MFSTLSKTEIIIFVTFNLSSANAFNLDQSKHLLSGNGLNLLNPFPNKPWFLRVGSKVRLKNTVGKGEIARDEQFLFFPTVFFTDFDNFLPFFIKSETVVCKLFQFSRV